MTVDWDLSVEGKRTVTTGGSARSDIIAATSLLCMRHLQRRQGIA